MFIASELQLILQFYLHIQHCTFQRARFNLKPYLRALGVIYISWEQVVISYESVKLYNTITHFIW